MTDMTILAWHFVGKTLRNGQPIPKDGEWLEYKEKLVMCKSGLHASRHPFDALTYAPGPILCRVQCEGEIIEEKDKLVCSRRLIVERADATEGLFYFARTQALSVVHLWEPPDVVLEYLMTGDEEIGAAAGAAARDVAWDAARAAAGAAARDVAWDAARDAAGAVARAAARDAARAAALDAAWVAARAAARDAAWVAARAAARADWAELVKERFVVP